MKAAVTVSTRGQIVLPITIRKAIQIEQGDLLLMEVMGDKIVLKPSGKPLSPSIREEKIKCLKETAGALPQLNPGYVDELREAAAKRLDELLP